MAEKRFMKRRKLILEPEEFYKYINWVTAIYDWERGYPVELAFLVEHFHIPPILKPVIGKIIRGEKAPTKRGQSNQSALPSERLEVAIKLERQIESNRQMVNHWLAREDLRYYLNTKRSDKALYSGYIALGKAFREQSARKAQVEVRTINEWLKELRKLKKMWPNL